MHLIADAVHVVAGGGQHDDQRLRARRHRRRQHVVQFTVTLRVQFVEQHGRTVETVFRPRLCADGFVEPGFEMDGMLQHPAPAGQGFVLLDHAGGDVEDDARLVTVAGRADDFRASFLFGNQQVQRNGRRQVRFAVFTWDFNVACTVFACAVGPFPPEQRPDDVVFLPRFEQERTLVAFDVGAK